MNQHNINTKVTHVSDISWTMFTILIVQFFRFQVKGTLETHVQRMVIVLQWMQNVGTASVYVKRATASRLRTDNVQMVRKHVMFYPGFITC